MLMVLHARVWQSQFAPWAIFWPQWAHKQVSRYPFPCEVRVTAVVRAVGRAERTDGQMIRSIHILGHHTTLVQALFRSIWAFRVLVRDLIFRHQVRDLTTVHTFDNSELTFELHVPREPVSSEVPDAAGAAVVV